MTMSGMGCHALTVITALTVQDTVGVEDVLPVDADFVAEQARAVLEDMPVQAFKLGVLGSVENIAVIAEIISDYPHIPVIVDPVIASGRGDELASEAMLATLRELIIPFGNSGYVALFEIETGGHVTILALRHQREDDYH